MDPRLARILHCADAFEGDDAARPYRMTPLTNEQALAELRKFAGIQFDLEVGRLRPDALGGRPGPGRKVELDRSCLPNTLRAAKSAFDGPAPGSPASDLA
jgi:HD-GYP domain-containing protein (c-di-GMP phosphodiesterase class II)